MGHQEDTPGEPCTTLEQTNVQDLGARVRLGVVLLRYPSTYVGRQRSSQRSHIKMPAASSTSGLLQNEQSETLVEEFLRLQARSSKCQSTPLPLHPLAPTAHRPLAAFMHEKSGDLLCLQDHILPGKTCQDSQITEVQSAPIWPSGALYSGLQIQNLRAQ